MFEQMKTVNNENRRLREENRQQRELIKNLMESQSEKIGSLSTIDSEVDLKFDQIKSSLYQ